MILNTTQKPNEFWRAVQGELQLKIGSAAMYSTTIARTTCLEMSENEVVVGCADGFVLDQMEKIHADNVIEVVRKIAKKDLKVRFKIDRQINSENSVKPLSEDLGPLFLQKDPQTIIEEKRNRSNLSPKYTFESFIMGNNNNLAYAIATAIANNPGDQYNPFFLYGGVGLGKTHLIQAIGNKILKDKPGMRVIYTSGEAFTNELIESLQSGKGGKYSANDFRNKFRKADVFLIDDVQFVIGKSSTQEEFFHTFNALYMAQKQIVITSDRPPKDFNNLEARITSRFSSGIIADIQAPDFEMRAAILRTKRDSNRDPISDEVLNYIAENIDSNIRELEGAYNQLIPLARIKDFPLTVDEATSALRNNIKDRPKRIANVNDVIRAVCTYYSVKAVDLKGKRRTKDIVIPRQVAMYLMKELIDMPYMGIGELLGGRDHTTIMHGVDKIGSSIDGAPKLKQDLVNVEQIIFSE